MDLKKIPNDQHINVENSEVQQSQDIGYEDRLRLTDKEYQTRLIAEISKHELELRKTEFAQRQLRRNDELGKLWDGINRKLITLVSLIFTIPGYISKLINAALLIVAILLSAVTASEVTIRMQVHGKIDSMEKEAIRLIVDSQIGAINQINMTPHAMTKSAPIANIRDAEEYVNNQLAFQSGQQTILLRRAKLIRGFAAEARTEIEALSMKGRLVRPDVLLIVLESAIRSAQNNYADKLSPETATLSQYGKYFSEWPKDDFLAELWSSLKYSRSDFLLAIGIISCSIIGSIVAGFRSGRFSFEIIQLMLGFASGYIAFISIRGGKSILLVEMSGDMPTFNSYSISFVGLIVGLFSNKAYNLLSSLVDDLSSRLSAVLMPSGKGQEKPENNIEVHNEAPKTLREGNPENNRAPEKTATGEIANK